MGILAMAGQRRPAGLLVPPLPIQQHAEIHRRGIQHLTVLGIGEGGAVADHPPGLPSQTVQRLLAAAVLDGQGAPRFPIEIPARGGFRKSRPAEGQQRQDGCDGTQDRS